MNLLHNRTGALPSKCAAGRRRSTCECRVGALGLVGLLVTTVLGIWSCGHSDDAFYPSWSVRRQSDQEQLLFGFTERVDEETGTLMWHAESWADPAGSQGHYARGAFPAERWTRLHELSRPEFIAAYVGDEGCGGDWQWEGGPTTFYHVTVFDAQLLYTGCLSSETASHTETRELLEYLDQLAAEFETALAEYGTRFP